MGLPERNERPININILDTDITVILPMFQLTLLFVLAIKHIVLFRQ